MRTAIIPRVRIPIERGTLDMTFRDFARGCYQQLGSWGYAEGTQHVYDRAWMQFLAFVKGRGDRDDIRSFNDDLVFAFSEDLGRRGINPNTTIKTLSALSTLAKYGMMCKDEKGRPLVSRDPTKSFRWPTAQRQETQFLYPDDLRRLLEIQAPSWKSVARNLLVETGIRVGEASRLNVEDLSEVGGRYYLAVKLKGRGQRKKKETRQVPLSRAGGDEIRNWLLLRGTQTDPDSPILLNRDGKRWTRGSLSNMIARLAAEAGISRLRVSGHKLRHTANVIARLGVVDPPTRSRLLGHTSARSLERYDHVLPFELHQARERQLEALQDYIGEPFRHERETVDEKQNAADDATRETS
jgi:integrase